jgi:hypothetical protein
MSATTQDGFAVEVRGVRYRYRLLADPASDPASGRVENPYSFSEEAVLNMAYNRTLSEQGVTPWYYGINFNLDSGVTDYISHHQIDHLTAPNSSGKDPRQEIYDRLMTGPTRERLLERGAELTWMDLGHFEVLEEEVGKQHVSTWQAKWIGDAKILRAQGEARRIAYQDLGRAEAQADILVNIVHALEQIGMPGDSRQNMRTIYLARIAQLLDIMGRQYLPSGE